MEKFRCVQKQYGRNGEVVAYNLMNENGFVQTYDKKEVKKAIKQKRIEVVNLQISKDGRLVDKAINLDKQSNSNDMQKILTYIYEVAYRTLLSGGIVPFEKRIEDGKYQSIFYNEIYEILKKEKLETKLDIYQVTQGFDNYIREKYTKLPLKLSIKFTVGDQRHYIIYSLNNASIDLINIWINDLGDESKLNPKVHLNRENYKIYGVDLDSSHPKPIAVVATCNEKDGAIYDDKNYIKGRIEDFPPDATYLIMITIKSNDSKYNNTIGGIELRKGLSDIYIIIDENKGTYKKGNKSLFLQNLKYRFTNDSKLYHKLCATPLGKLLIMFNK